MKLIPFSEVEKFYNNPDYNIDSLPTIDPIATIDEEIQKHEYLSAKFLQESDRVTGSIDFKRMSDIEKGVVIALKDIKYRLLLTQK